MKRFIWVAALCTLGAVSPAYAGFSCGGPFLDSDRGGFEQLFSPAYGPALSHLGGRVIDDNFAKKLAKSQMEALDKPSPKPVASTKLTKAGATWLMNALNTRSQDQVPGWVSSIIGVYIPAAWVGVSADVTFQLINNAGDAGRLQLANVAGTVSEGGIVTVFERIASDTTGQKQFLWIYAYTAEINGKPTTAMLSVCRADMVVQP